MRSMALARTTPKKTAKKPAKRKASTKWPTEWPREDSPAFRKLPPEEQAWVRHARPWYVRNRILGSASSIEYYPEVFARVKQNREWYLPFLVKYFRVSPRIFTYVLFALTGLDLSGDKTVPSAHKAWRDWLKARPIHVKAAAELRWFHRPLLMIFSVIIPT